MSEQPPDLSRLPFPTAATAAALSAWDRRNRFAAHAALLDSLSLNYLAPRIPPHPGLPSTSLRIDGFAAARECLGSPIAAGRFRDVLDALDEASEAMRAYERRSQAAAHRRRMSNLALGFLAHAAFMALAMGGLLLGLPESAVILLLSPWVAVVAGSALALRRWVDPVLSGRDAAVTPASRDPEGPSHQGSPRARADAAAFRDTATRP